MQRNHCARRRSRCGNLAPGGLDAKSRSRTVHHRAARRNQRSRDWQAQRRHLPLADERAAAAWPLCRRRAAGGTSHPPIRCEKRRHAGGDSDRCRPDDRARIDHEVSLWHRRVRRRRRTAWRSVPLVRCETNDLEVPANAEIVLEGIIRTGYREPEGPFGEFSGYMSPGGQTPVIEVTCMTRRHNPVYHSFLSQMPPSESSCIRSLSRSAGLFHHLKQVLGLPVRDVHFTESGGASGMLVISMKKEYLEQVKEVAWGAWSLMNKECKFTIVVDDDIDVRSPFQVEWAMSFHAQPARDTFTVSGVVPSGVDPSTAPSDIPQHDPQRRAGSKMLIDATRKHPYPPAARVPAEFTRAAQKKWKEYGFSK